jgi:glycosyltransferase involved in cell wall biosynthesis
MISQYLPGGSKSGVGYWAHALANELSSRGHHVTMFSACPAASDAHYTTHVIPLRGRLRTFRFALAMRTLDLSRYDVLHAHGDDYWLWRRRTPAHVRTMHGSCFEEALHISGLRETLRMIALGLGETVASLTADATVCVSPATRRWMPWVRRVIPAGVDLETFRPGCERDPRPTILFVGTYARRKRGRLLMEVFADQVLPKLPAAQLWMVSADAPPAPGVTVLGRVSPSELVSRYRRAWVFCLPSSYEGLGIPYIEALACATPVVATPNPGARYVLDGGRAGVICEATDLGSALRGLLCDNVRRDALSRRGLARSREFGLAAAVDEYERIYQRLLNLQPATGHG